jgi:hypothetical protein
VPVTLDPAEAATLMLNYLVAYQVMHRSAKVKAGEKVLIIGASGGVGTAFLQLGRLANVNMYGIASRSKHDVLTEYGAVPIDYRTQDFVKVIRGAEPGGLDAVFDGRGKDYVQRGLSVLRRGGCLVLYGNPLSFAGLLRLLAKTLVTNVLPNGKTVKLYGTSASRFNRRPLLEDWSALFKLLGEGSIKPIIMKKLPLVEAAKANALLESGQVVGNVVLLAAELSMVKGWRGRSWLLGSVLTGDRLWAMLVVLHVGAGILILASGVAIALPAQAPGWWAPLAIVGSALGVAGFAVFWDGQTGRIAEEGGIGAAISLALLLAAVAFPGAFG